MAAFSLGVVAISSCGGATKRDGGAAVAGTDSGNSGSGSGGSAPDAGGGSDRRALCEYDGQFYDDGESFPASDGCNTCSCDDGAVGCTELGCNPCPEIEQRWSSAWEEAKQCDPNEPGGCSAKVIAGQPCACDTFVNPARSDAIVALEQAGNELQASTCFGPVECEQCAPPVTGVCTPDGVCEDVWGSLGQGASCKVRGIVYPDGAAGIQGPTGCNTCDCLDGALDCDAACKIKCAAEDEWGSRCIECGPAGGCAVVEHGCVPACDYGSCASAAEVCVGDVCSLLCE
jgi:hypothetical protein